MLEVIKTLIFVSFQTVSSTYVNIKLSNKTLELKKIKTWAILLLITVATYFLWKYAYNIYKTLLLFGVWTVGYKYLFNFDFNESIIINFLGMVITAISEILFVIVTIIILRIPETVIAKYITGNPLSAILSLILVMLILRILKKYIYKIKGVLNKDWILYAFYIISMLGLAVFLNRNLQNLNDYKELSLNIITIFLFFSIMFLLLQEKIKTDKIKKEYDNMFDYLQNTETLLEKYQKYNHENKNQLVVLKSMASKNKKVVEFIDSILADEIDHKNRWINELKNIPNGGLKGLLSYKINHMIDNKIKVTVNTSPRVKNFKFNKFSTKMYKDICKIIGVYIDNAYEASKESKKKEVTIEMITEKDSLIIIISNTFDGTIDLNNIDKSGYTTKGSGHGVGLSLVKDIIKANKNLEQKRQIIQDYYFQYLYINL